MPGRAERAGRDVVGLLGEDVEVGVLRLVHELQVGQRRGALRDDPGVEVRPQVAVGPVVLGPEPGPAASGRRRGSRRTPAGCRRRAPRAGCRRRSARRARRQVSSAGKATTLSSTTTSGRTRSRIVAQLRLAVPRAVDQRLPGRPDERLELLRVGLRNSGAVSRMKSFQNAPASCSSGLSVGRRGQVDQVLLEAERRQPAAPGRLGREHHPVPAAAQHVADADALVGRPVRRLRHEQDGQGRGHSGRRLRRAGERSWSPPAATGHPAGWADRWPADLPGPVGPRPAGPAGAGAPR